MTKTKIELFGISFTVEYSAETHKGQGWASVENVIAPNGESCTSFFSDEAIHAIETAITEEEFGTDRAPDGSDWMDKAKEP